MAKGNKRHKRPAPAAPVDLSPDEQRFKGRDVQVIDLPGHGRRVSAVHSILDRYHKLGEKDGINSRQYMAGDRFRDDYHACGHSVQGMDYSQLRVDGGTNKSIPDSRLDAMQRFGGAIVALGGEGHFATQIALWVCCQDRTAKDWARGQGHHEKAGMATLREALNVLARHYGF